MSPASLDSHEALLQLLYLSPIGLLQTTADGTITMINPVSARLLMTVTPDGNLDNLFDLLEAHVPELRGLATDRTRVEALVCDDLRFSLPALGGTMQTVVSLRMLRLDADRLIVSLTDVTPIVEREAQRLLSTLKAASRIDALTQLPNRSVAIERIAAVLEAARIDPGFEFAVLFIDCDRFDRINTTLGSGVGDELLRLIGGRLDGAVRQADRVGGGTPVESAAARLGGDEFVLVLRGLRHADDAPKLARRLLDTIARPFVIGAHTIYLTASIGVVLRGQAANEPEAVLQEANIAMHEAKRAGGARYAAFDPTMQARAARRSQVENDLRQAVAEAELFVVYQPIVRMGGDGDCVGVEALVRWQHPVRGVVPPIEFIEIAEETGLIVELGDFVLREACRQLAVWQRELGSAAPQCVSVNLSRAQLREGPFVDRVERALLACGLPPSALQLEITESLAAQDESVQHQLQALKRLGVSLALDDFGTGYSSLSNLHLLPVDVVKIDRSFVSQAETSAHHRVLIEATVKVAKSLGMTTVAEGIETDRQAEHLVALRCDKGQGYLYARPLSATDASRWLAEHAAVSTA